MIAMSIVLIEKPDYFPRQCGTHIYQSLTLSLSLEIHLFVRTTLKSCALILNFCVLAIKASISGTSSDCVIVALQLPETPSLDVYIAVLPVTPFTEAPQLLSG